MPAVDADLFLTLCVLDPDGADVDFVAALDPAGVIGMGWLRASHHARPGAQLALPAVSPARERAAAHSRRGRAAVGVSLSAFSC
jgi:hypothetical protein